MIQIPSKQLTSRKRIRAASQHLVPLRRVMYYCHLLSYLCWLAVTWRADGAALLSPRISPDDTGHPPSHCKAVKLFCSGTSGFQGSLFLLQLLAIVSLHSSALLPPLPSICASGGGFERLAVVPLQIDLSTSYSTPSIALHSFLSSQVSHFSQKALH